MRGSIVRIADGRYATTWTYTLRKNCDTFDSKQIKTAQNRSEEIKGGSHCSRTHKQHSSWTCRRLQKSCLMAPDFESLHRCFTCNMFLVRTVHDTGNVYCLNVVTDGRRFSRKVGTSKRIGELVLKDLELQIARKRLSLDVQDAATDELFQAFLASSETNQALATIRRRTIVIQDSRLFLTLNYPIKTKISQLERANDRSVNAEDIRYPVMYLFFDGPEPKVRCE